MPTLLALLVAVTTGAVVYLIISLRTSNSFLSTRLDSVTTSQSTLYDPSMSAKVEEFKASKKVQSSDVFQKHSLEKKLYLAGYRKQKHINTFRAARIITFILPVVLILLQLVNGTVSSNSILQTLLIGVGLYIVLIFLINHLKKKRQKAITKAMPTFFDLLVIALESGVNFTAALPRILREIEENDPLGQEFSTLHAEYLAGVTFKDACRNLAKRCEVEDLTTILNALIESEEMGSSLAGTLRIQSDELRHKMKMEMKEKAQKMPIKLLLPMMLIFSTVFVFTFGPLGTKIYKTMFGSDGLMDSSSAPTFETVEINDR